MPREKEAPRRMMKDALGNEYPAKQLKTWMPAPEYDDIQELAVEQDRSTAAQARQMLKERTAQIKGDGKGSK